MDSAALEDLMAQNMPWIEPEDYSWHDMHDGRAPRVEAIAAMLSVSVGTGEVFVHILAEPDVYAQVNASEAPEFIGRHVLRGRIHVSNPAFNGFLVVMSNGVATAWKEGEHEV
jgi:hypothetical protein